MTSDNGYVATPLDLASPEAVTVHGALSRAAAAEERARTVEAELKRLTTLVNDQRWELDKRDSLGERIALAIEAAGHLDGFHQPGLDRASAGMWCGHCAVTTDAARIARETT